MILASLRNTHDVLQQQGKLPWPGYEQVRLGYVLVLDRHGTLRTVRDLTRETVLQPVPVRVVRKSTMIAGNLLWDNPEYALGLGDKPAAERRKRLDAFRRRLDELPSDARSDEGVEAVRAFLRGHDPATFAATERGEMITDFKKSVAFALDADEGDLICQRPAVQRYVAGIAHDTPAIVCAVSGEPDNLARLHPSVGGVPGGNPMGASLVSFNTPAANHYGREQGENAGIGVRTAAAYGRTLDYLLATPAHRIRCGSHVILAWADNLDAGRGVMQAIFAAAEGDEEGGAAEDSVPVEDAAAVRAVYRAPWLGLSPADLERDFYVLGLTGVNARIAVSAWHQSKLGDVVDHCRAWFADLELAGRRPQARSDGRGVMDIVRVLMPPTRGKRIDFNKLPGRHAAKLVNAALLGGPIPSDLAYKALRRLHIGAGLPDDDHTRTALLKAFLIRSRGMTLAPTLDRTRTEIGYLLGRLLAVVERAQQASSGGNAPNVTVRDRFWAMLSATPARALPMVDSMFVAYAKRGRGQLSWLEREIDEIRGLMRQVPATLPFEQQALFGIGYSQQRTSLWQPAPDRPGKAAKAGANKAAQGGADKDADLFAALPISDATHEEATP